MSLERRIRNLEALLGASPGVTPATIAQAKITSLVSDAALRPPQFMRSGHYIPVPRCTSVTTSNAVGNGNMRIVPFYVPRSLTVTKIAAEVTSAGDSGSKIRLGIYADDGTGYPGALVIDAGTIAGDSVGVQEITISQALSPGWYWMAFVVQLVTVTQPTVRIAANMPLEMYVGPNVVPTAAQTHLGYFQNGITGALPSNITSTVNTSGVAPRVFIKVT